MDRIYSSEDSSDAWSSLSLLTKKRSSDEYDKRMYLKRQVEYFLRSPREKFLLHRVMLEFVVTHIFGINYFLGADNYRGIYNPYSRVYGMQNKSKFDELIDCVTEKHDFNEYDVVIYIANQISMKEKYFFEPYSCGERFRKKIEVIS